MMENSNLINVLLSGKETKEIDYKAPCKWDSKDKKACCEIVKDILAFSNTKGGYLFIGVEENETLTLKGLSDEQLSSFESTKINQFVNNYADPPINLTIEKLTYDGRRFAAICIPVFNNVPHICQKMYPDVLIEGALYVRTDNNESAPIKKSSDFQNVIETSIRNRTDQMLTSFRSILKYGALSEKYSDNEQQYETLIKEIKIKCYEINPQKEGDYGYCEAIYYPSYFNEKFFDFDQLKTALSRASINYTGLPFILYEPNNSDITYNLMDGIETKVIDSISPGKESIFHFWRFTRSGLMYRIQTLIEDTYYNIKAKILDMKWLIYRVAQSIDCLVRLYSEIPDDTNITLIFSIQDAYERKLCSLDGSFFLFRGKYISHEENITLKYTKSLADWRAGKIDHAVEICNQVFLLFNYEKPDKSLLIDSINNMFKRKL